MPTRWSGNDSYGNVSRAEMKALPKTRIQAKQAPARQAMAQRPTAEVSPLFVLRAYTVCAPGTTLVVVSRTLGCKGWQVSVEHRRTTAPGKVQPYPHTDTTGVLAVVAQVAADLARDPARCGGALRVVTDDSLDAGVACRASLILLAAVAHAGRLDDASAA